MPGMDVPIDINVLLNRHNPSDFIDAVQACQFARARANRYGQFHWGDAAFWGAVARHLAAHPGRPNPGIESS